MLLYIYVVAFLKLFHIERCLRFLLKCAVCCSSTPLKHLTGFCLFYSLTPGRQTRCSLGIFLFQVPSKMKKVLIKAPNNYLHFQVLLHLNVFLYLKAQLLKRACCFRGTQEEPDRLPASSVLAKPFLQVKGVGSVPVHRRRCSDFRCMELLAIQQRLADSESIFVS